MTFLPFHILSTKCVCVFLAQLTDFFSDDIRSTLIWKIFSMWFLISVYKCKKVQRAAQTKKTQVQKTTILHYLSFEGGREGDGEGINQLGRIPGPDRG